MTSDSLSAQYHDYEPEQELVRRLTAAMREADDHFENVGGSTRHHVRDCLLPILEKHGLEIRLLEAYRAPQAT